MMMMVMVVAYCSMRKHFFCENINVALCHALSLQIAAQALRVSNIKNAHFKVTAIRNFNLRLHKIRTLDSDRILNVATILLCYVIRLRGT
jgi:hypothetical protein